MNRILLPLMLLPLAGCEILEEDITNRRIEITAPTDGARVAAGDVCFAWRGVEHASGYEFTIVLRACRTHRGRHRDIRRLHVA